ncbi:MAG: tRNA (N(6)-L-threonylcarbamoyladenosine(37)-C(2))-methylthiotransferase MtaB [Nitrospirota bacterium]|nr:tRNA (N(6)-L-threonylcarbamoyladenosine(37)-C(2))-methylthiotransferase MtaB [Nitrospirota bacterium]
MRIAFSSFGCKINQVETEEMVRAAVDGGSSIVPFEDRADVYVINTCSVTGKSDYQCRQAIRAAVRRGKGAQVIVTGCYAEMRPEEIRKIPGVSAVISNRDKDSLIPAVMTDLRKSASKVEQADVPVPGGRTRSFLKVQDGCDNYCSYCLIPYARGRSRSVDFQQVVEQFDTAVSSGTPEVVLSGIHIGKYGLDLQPGRTLSELLVELLARRKEARIRLSSIEPREVSVDIVSMAGRGLCRHLHVPLQSGDDTILKAMNRDYDSGFYRELMHSIAASVPGIALGADVIVGFPGEGDREFENTLSLIRDCPITHLHVFTYSRRPGTAAAAMPNQVNEEDKRERSRILRELALQKNLIFRRKFVGSTLRVAIESGEHQQNGSIFKGMTDNYIRVTVSGAVEADIGKEIDVAINAVSESDTMGASVTH